MPANPGNYKIRWIKGYDTQAEEYARVGIQVVSAEISLIAHDSAIANTEISIDIKAPQGLIGYLYLYRSGSDKSISRVDVRENPSTESYRPSNLRMPSEAGDYDIRWIRGYETDAEEYVRKSIKVVPAE